MNDKDLGSMVSGDENFWINDLRRENAGLLFRYRLVVAAISLVALCLLILVFHR